MPHAVIPITTLTATAEAVPRTFVPGVEPGGARAGQETKPAMLIRDCWFVPSVIAPNTAGSGQESAVLFLKLSQESDMTPGLQLPIASLFVAVETAVAIYPAAFKDEFRAQGTVWAPRFVGVRAVLSGTWTALTGDIHLDYERVDVPWMDWFIMWDFLDNVVDNELEY